MAPVVTRGTAVLLLLVMVLVLIAAPVTAQEFNNPSHANVEGVDYIPQDGNNNYTFYVTIYSEDDTGDSTPLYWEAVSGNETVIQHDITDPVEDEDEPRYHSEGTYQISSDIEVLEFRAYDNAHGYGGATVEVDIAREDFQNEEADPIDLGTSGGGSNDGDSTGNETEDGTASGPMGGPSGSGEGSDASGGNESSADGATNSSNEPDDDGDTGITDQVEDGVDEFTDSIEEASGGTSPILLLLLIGAVTVIAFVAYRRSRD